MTKILYFVEDGRFGGMAKMIVDLAASVSVHDISSKIIIGSSHSDYLVNYIRSRNVDFEMLRLATLSKNTRAIFQFLLYFPFDVLKLIQIIRRESPDLVYCNGSQHIKSVIAGRLLNKNVIWHMHDTYQPKIILKLFKYVCRIFQVRSFAASCERTISYYGLPKTNTLLSLPPVDTEKYKPVVRRRLAPNTKINVITISNVNPDKGLDTLIHTAAIINKSRNDVTFQIVGLVPDTQRLLYKELLDLLDKLEVNNVYFLGQRSDITSLLLDADLYLCCSNNESGPISVFEAMSMKVPVVSTDVGDLRKIFSIDGSGKIRPVKDFNGLADEILLLLEHPEEMKNMAEKGRLTAINRLDIKVLASRHVNFYQELTRNFNR